MPATTEQQVSSLPNEVKVGLHRGISLRCPVCQCDKFHKREYALKNPVAALLRLDWCEDSTTVYVCETCSYMLWFAQAASLSSGAHVAGAAEWPVETATKAL